MRVCTVHEWAAVRNALDRRSRKRGEINKSSVPCQRSQIEISAAARPREVKAPPRWITSDDSQSQRRHTRRSRGRRREKTQQERCRVHFDVTVVKFVKSFLRSCGIYLVAQPIVNYAVRDQQSEKYNRDTVCASPRGRTRIKTFERFRLEFQLMSLGSIKQFVKSAATFNSYVFCV